MDRKSAWRIVKTAVEQGAVDVGNLQKVVPRGTWTTQMRSTEPETLNPKPDTLNP